VSLTLKRTFFLKIRAARCSYTCLSNFRSRGNHAKKFQAKTKMNYKKKINFPPILYGAASVTSKYKEKFLRLVLNLHNQY
jgi:hypothetical protein